MKVWIGNIALIYFKQRADDLSRVARTTPNELFGVTSNGGFRLRDVPGKGVIDIDTVPIRLPRTTGKAAATTADIEALADKIRYKTIDDMEESRILDLAGVNMKKKLDEASISINGADSAEVAEILNISVKTVENQMGKALRMLKDKLSAVVVILILIFLPIGIGVFNLLGV